MINYGERAAELFGKGYNCAQSVAGAFAETAGMSLETMVKLASSFGRQRNAHRTRRYERLFRPRRKRREAGALCDLQKGYGGVCGDKRLVRVYRVVDGAKRRRREKAPVRRALQDCRGYSCEIY